VEGIFLGLRGKSAVVNVATPESNMDKPISAANANLKFSQLLRDAARVVQGSESFSFTIIRSHGPIVACWPCDNAGPVSRSVPGEYEYVTVAGSLE
jgi:hypothetical protein